MAFSNLDLSADSDAVSWPCANSVLFRTASHQRVRHGGAAVVAAVEEALSKS